MSETSLVPFMRKQFHESVKGRVYQKGLHLVPQDIAAIHKQLESKSIKEAAIFLRMDVRTVKKYSNGNSTQQIGGNRKENNDLMENFIKNMVKENPTFYLEELKKKLTLNLDIHKSISSLSRFLKNRLNMSKKKVVKVCFYRTTERVQYLRLAFRNYIQNFHPYRFFYLDESHFDSSTMGVYLIDSNLAKLWMGP